MVRKMPGPKDDLTKNKFGTLQPKYWFRKNNRIYWHCICDCGAERDVLTSHLKDGHTRSCGSCTRAKNLVGQKFGKLLVIEKTKKRTNDRKVIWKCLCDCGNIHETDTSSLLLGRVQSCGCEISRGENQIEKILTNNNINYIKQFDFDDCKNPETNFKLKFDFYLVDYNILIEYDGIQHFHWQNNSDWNTKEKFFKTRQLDIIKNNYCKEHSITLIRIPYTVFQVTLQDLLPETSSFIYNGEEYYQKYE